MRFRLVELLTHHGQLDTAFFISSAPFSYPLISRVLTKSAWQPEMEFPVVIVDCDSNQF